jgi:hypothetical protein
MPSPTASRSDDSHAGRVQCAVAGISGGAPTRSARAWCFGRPNSPTPSQPRSEIRRSHRRHSERRHLRRDCRFAPTAVIA